MSAATVAASRGHQVTLFEASNEVGGQFNLAKVVPGKKNFTETIRYFKVQIEKNWGRFTFKYQSESFEQLRT